MKLWTIYERPAEYPNLYVARESEVGGNEDAPRTKRMKFSPESNSNNALVPAAFHWIPSSPLHRQEGTAESECTA